MRVLLVCMTAIILYTLHIAKDEENKINRTADYNLMIIAAGDSVEVISKDTTVVVALEDLTYYIDSQMHKEE